MARIDPLRPSCPNLGVWLPLSAKVLCRLARLADRDGFPVEAYALRILVEHLRQASRGRS